MRIDLQSIKLFIDTHGKASGKDDFAGVYRQYAEACRAEGVVVVNTMVSAGEGRMYCVNLAPDADRKPSRRDARGGLARDCETETGKARGNRTRLDSPRALTALVKVPLGIAVPQAQRFVYRVRKQSRSIEKRIRVSRVVPVQPEEGAVVLALVPSGRAATPPTRPQFPLPVPLAAIAEELARNGEWPGADLALRFFPVFDFQRQAVAALFCTPMYSRAGTQALYGHKAFHDLPAEEWSAIDCAILAHTLAFAGRLAAAHIIAGVGASVSFATLSDPVGRMKYREALRAAHAREQALLVLKIEDVPDRVGGRRIAEIVSSVRMLVPRVWVHLPGSHVPLGGHEQLHASGMVLSMPPGLPMHGMATEARWLSKVAQMQSALACMDHVDTVAELDVTRSAGVRFIAGGAVGCPALAGNASIEAIRESVYCEASTKRG